MTQNLTNKSHIKSQVEQAILFPSDITERLIVKKFLSDTSYASFISENLNPLHLDSEIAREAISMGIAYRKKYSDNISVEKMGMLLVGIGKVDAGNMLPSYVNGINFELDEDHVKENIKSYIQQKSLFNLIFANSDRILKDRNVIPYINELQRISSIDFCNNLGFDYFNNLQEHEFDLQNPEARTSTGYSELDRIMVGGFPTAGKCITVFMAQPGLGKSMFMHNLAANMVQLNKKVLIVSLEMTEMIYARRISSNLTGANINMLGTNENIGLIRKRAAEIASRNDNAGLIIKEFPPDTFRAIALNAYIERLIANGFKPDIVFLDYLNLMKPNTSMRDSNSYERVGEIMKEVRALSYKFGVPFVTATQSNRDGFDNTNLSMRNVSDSTQTPAHADALFALSTEGPESGIITLTVLKNRFGGQQGAKINFMVDYASLRLIQTTPNRPTNQSEVDGIIGRISTMDPNRT